MPRTRRQILQEIGAIRQMEPGKVIVCRKGKDDPRLEYYAHSYYEQGRSRLRYLRQSEKEAMEALVAQHARFRALVQEYEDLVISETRRRRAQSQTAEPSTSKDVLQESPKNRRYLSPQGKRR